MSTNLLSVTKITLSLEKSLGPNVDDGPFVTMKVDDEPYVMLTIKRSIMAAKLVEVLRRDFGVTRALVGIAFNYRESIQSGMLVILADPNINGVYVPFSELNGHVRQILHQ
jgi:hypothetical protein